jgi:hypothetical protein
MITLFLPLLALAQPAECPINPKEPGVVASIAADQRALELRKDGAFCRIELDCTLRARPTGLRYELGTLKGLKTAPVATQMTSITFQFAEGAPQTCNSTGSSVQETKADSSVEKPAATPPKPAPPQLPGTLPGDPIPIEAN